MKKLPTKLYKIEWRVSGILKETLNEINPRPIAVINSFIRLLKKSTYKIGTLTPIEVK